MSATPTKTRTASPRAASARKTGVREQAAQTTRDNILKAATKVFARYGYEGGSLEKISSAAKSFDRMVYYYFGSKEGLFIAVVEDMYRRMNEAEMQLKLDLADPVLALREVVRFFFGYYRRHPEFLILINTENLHKGRHLAKSPRARDFAREYSSPAMSVIAQVLEAGAASGRFRAGLVARDIYLLILATGYFYVSNRHTLSHFLGEDLEDAASHAHWEEFVTETVLRTLTPAAQIAD